MAAWLPISDGIIEASFVMRLAGNLFVFLVALTSLGCGEDSGSDDDQAAEDRAVCEAACMWLQDCDDGSGDPIDLNGCIDECVGFIDDAREGFGDECAVAERGWWECASTLTCEEGALSTEAGPCADEWAARC